MSFLKEVYYCCECKSFVPSAADLLYVENDSTISFCSEECIENFYEHLVEFYEGLENKWRVKYDLEQETVHEVIGHPVYMDQVLRRPTEVWCFEDDNGQRVYSFLCEIKDNKYDKFYMMCLCLIYDNQPSFIISASATKNTTLFENYRWGEKEKNVLDFHSTKESRENPKTIHIDEEILMDVEGKKSRYLANLIEERSPADIPIESFGLYEEYFDKTMYGPDEIFKSIDDEGDYIFTYIKAHDREGVSFYYFIVCMKISKTDSKDTETLIPIVSFPSVDGDIYRSYRKGELISGNLRS